MERSVDRSSGREVGRAFSRAIELSVGRAGTVWRLDAFDHPLRRKVIHEPNHNAPSVRYRGVKGGWGRGEARGVSAPC